MMTESEVIKYVDDTYPECSHESRIKICMRIFAKSYANQKLDEAAEMAICEDLSSDNYGGYSTNWQVDKQSILSLKDKV